MAGGRILLSALLFSALPLLSAFVGHLPTQPFPGLALSRRVCSAPARPDLLQRVASTPRLHARNANRNLGLRMMAEDGAVKNVVIAGAGPAGLMLAHYLVGSGKGFNVVMLEQRELRASLELPL